jgi:hypothetical protein
MHFRNTEFFEVTDAYQSPQEEAAGDDARVTQEVDIVPGTLEVRQDAYLDFLGYARIAVGKRGAQDVFYLTRKTPMPYVTRRIPDLNEENRPLYCVGIPSGRGMSAARKHPRYNTADYDRYRLTLTFRGLAFPVLEDDAVLATDSDNPLNGFPDEGEALQKSKPRYVTRYVDYGNRQVQVRGSMFFYVNEVVSPARDPIPEGVPFPDNFESLTYNWFGVPQAAYNREYCFQSLNKLNDRTFDGFPASCLLLAGIKETPRWGPLNDPLIDLSFHMRAVYHFSRFYNKPIGWNGILRKRPFLTSVDYVPISSDATLTGTLPFSSADFRLLFQPPQP